MVLGTAKVLISVLCFNIFNAVNFVHSFCILRGPFGAASLLGPILGWWSLSGHGFSTDANYKHEVSHAVGMFCYISAGAQAVCFVLSLFIRNLDFSQYSTPHDADDENDSIADVAISGIIRSDIENTDEEGELKKNLENI